MDLDFQAYSFRAPSVGPDSPGFPRRDVVIKLLRVNYSRFLARIIAHSQQICVLANERARETILETKTTV